jgi:carbon-monoxide dehydrogenase small subunit
MIDGGPDKLGISLTVNGEPRQLEVEPRKLLVDVLRQDLGLTGAHTGCEHGVCGTCTVLMNGESVRSCITFGVQADGAEITTIEGLAPSFDELHPLQEAFWEKQGLQCGYCTPGMVLRSLEILRENPTPTREQVREGIASNPCRCTGYQFIVDSVMDAAERMRSPDGVGAEPDGDGGPTPTDSVQVSPGGEPDDPSNPAPAPRP